MNSLLYKNLKGTKTAVHIKNSTEEDIVRNIIKDPRRSYRTPLATYPIQIDLYYNGDWREMKDREYNGHIILTAYDFIIANTVDTTDPEILKYLEDNFKLPEKIAILRTKDNYKEINRWFNKIYTDNYDGQNGYMHYPKVILDPWGAKIGFSSKVENGYTEITFDQFLKHVVNKALPQEMPKECQKMWEESDYKFTVTFQTINNKQNEKSNSIEVQRKAPKISRGKGVTGNSISGRRVRTTISLGHLSHKTVSIK